MKRVLAPTLRDLTVSICFKTLKVDAVKLPWSGIDNMSEL